MAWTPEPVAFSRWKAADNYCVQKRFKAAYVEVLAPIPTHYKVVVHIGKTMLIDMGMQSPLMSLPDLVLYDICSLLTTPFDLLNFGCTCRRVYSVTNSNSLWLRLAVDWCEGMWHWIEPVPSNADAKAWLLHVMHSVTFPAPGTRRLCRFDGGETWERIESMRFRCKLGMLRCTYKDTDNAAPPTVLLRRWMYDMALFRRVKMSIEFNDDNIEMSETCVAELAALGQAKERDLRARRNRNLHPRYYVKRIATSRDGWLEDLFPSGPQGTLCPMLVCPSEGGFTAEISGLSGLATCVSIVVSRHLRPHVLDGRLTLTDMTRAIQNVCGALKEQMAVLLVNIRARWPAQPVAHAVFSMAEDGWPRLDSWQPELGRNGITVTWQRVMGECAQLLRQRRWLDAVVDDARRAWRRMLLPEIILVLHGQKGKTSDVTRLNLTDCDVIGGDNQLQEMASAAFVSSFGVFVAWQLIGRGRI